MLAGGMPAGGIGLVGPVDMADRLHYKVAIGKSSASACSRASLYAASNNHQRDCMPCAPLLASSGAIVEAVWHAQNEVMGVANSDGALHCGCTSAAPYVKLRRPPISALCPLSSAPYVCLRINGVFSKPAHGRGARPPDRSGIHQ